MGIGWSEMFVLAVVALLVFGPKELPQVLRAVGGYMRQFRRMTNELQRQFNDALREAEQEINLENRRTTTSTAASAKPAPPETNSSS